MSAIKQICDRYLVSVCTFCLAFSIGSLLAFLCFYDIRFSPRAAYEPAVDRDQMQHSALYRRLLNSWGAQRLYVIVPDIMLPVSEEAIIPPTEYSLDEEVAENGNNDAEEPEIDDRVKPFNFSSIAMATDDPLRINSGESVTIQDTAAGNFTDFPPTSKELVVTEADYLEARIKVLCVIIMDTRSTASVKAINATYAKRCSDILYFGPVESAAFSIEYVPVDASFDSWDYLRYILLRIYGLRHLDNGFEWLILVHDDSYVILENLRQFLSVYEPTVPYAFGHKLQKRFLWWLPLYYSSRYLSGDAGIVLSAKAYRLLVAQLSFGGQDCRQTGAASALGRFFADASESLTTCLAAAGVAIRNAFDSETGGHRFLPTGPRAALLEAGSSEIVASWAKKNWDSVGSTVDEDSCCSDQVITFGRLRAKEIYLLDYLLYHLKGYGIVPHFAKDVAAMIDSNGTLVRIGSQSMKT